MKYMQGHATIEFALVSSIFFVMLFGVFEIARLLFVWNTLTESTRRSARMAVTCPINHENILNNAVFTGSSGSPILPNISTDNFMLEYLDENSAALSSPNNAYLSIRFIRVSIKPNQPVKTLIPGLSTLLMLPEFSTTLPIESMGIMRGNPTPQCQGSQI